MSCLSSFTADQLLTTGYTDRCGIYYTASQPLQGLAACCTGPVQVYEGCFQYCDTNQWNSSQFDTCATEHGVNTTATVLTCQKRVPGAQPAHAPNSDNNDSDAVHSAATQMLPASNVGKLGTLLLVLSLSALFY